MKSTNNSRKSPKTSKKAAAQPAVAEPASQPAAASMELKPMEATKTVTTIEAKIDVGFGNKLFVRGEGAGLSWDHGTPLTCLDPQTWRLTIEAKDPLKFKLLLNDAVWMAGEDLVATPGRRVEITPAF